MRYREEDNFTASFLKPITVICLLLLTVVSIPQEIHARQKSAEACAWMGLLVSGVGFLEMYRRTEAEDEARAQGDLKKADRLETSAHVGYAFGVTALSASVSCGLYALFDPDHDRGANPTHKAFAITTVVTSAIALPLWAAWHRSIIQHQERPGEDGFHREALGWIAFGFGALLGSTSLGMGIATMTVDRRLSTESAQTTMGISPIQNGALLTLYGNF